jgi:hypothetical protein
MSPPIREDFEDYVPPRWFQPTVERLLDSLSSAHTHGLSAIVLTNATRADRRKRTRAARRRRHGVPAGRYHYAYRGERAWVELIVDRIVAGIPRPLRHVQLARDLIVGNTLYHELGHHLHETIGSAAQGWEPSAEAWRKRLAALHGRNRYRHMRPLARPVRAVARWLAARRQRSRQLGR